MPEITHYLRGLRHSMRTTARTAFWFAAVVAGGLALAPKNAEAQGIEAVLNRLQRLEASIASIADAQGSEAVLGELQRLTASIAGVAEAHSVDLSRLEAEVKKKKQPTVVVDSSGVDASDIEVLHARLARLEEAIGSVTATVEADQRSTSIDSLAVIVAELSQAVERLSASALAQVVAAQSAATVQVQSSSAPSQVVSPLRIPMPVVGGSLRMRGEMRSHFKFGAEAPGDTEDFGLTQFRVNVKWQPVEWVSLYVEGQDARIYGEEAINAKAVPNIFADEMDLHQAHVTFRSPKESTVPFTLKVGRQKFNMGAQRLIASLEWVNTARVWDGVRLDVGKAKDRTVSLFASRLVPVDPSRLNGHAPTGSRMFNSYFHGVYYTDWKIVPGAQVEGYWLLRDQNDAGDHVNTAGSRFKLVDGVWDWEVEAATQWGSYGDLDHSATMLHAGVGYKPPALNGARFGAAYSFGSGDDDPNDGKHGTFDNQYPLNHAYYGYMDFFALQNVHNAEATFNTTVGSGWALRMAYQGFWLVHPDTDAWYNAGAGVIRRAETPGVGRYVGSEIDVTLKRTFLQKKLLVEVGYGRFLAGAYVDDTGPSQDPDFFYLQTKISR